MSHLPIIPPDLISIVHFIALFSEALPFPKIGAITNPIKQVNFIKMFIDGPEVSLKGSPTVSPVTAALCASDPLKLINPSTKTPASNDFLALSQAPPALFWKIAQTTPETVTPAIYPPSISATMALALASFIYTNLPIKTIPIGKPIVKIPGNIISCKAALVEISTHFAYSGFPVPSIIPGISLN